MPQNDKEFLIRVRADINKAVTELRKVSGEIDKTDRRSRTASKHTTALGKSFDTLVAGASAYLTVATAIKALRMADDWNTLQQRIKTATKETGDYAAVSEQLYDISRRNGAAMADTVSIFQRLSIARKELNATNDELLKVTDSVQQLGRASGASGTAMRAGLLQFAQAMSAGTVRAEELNSIIENIPAVADRIARGMGMTVGELRNAVLAGEVLSRDVFDALLSQTEAIAAEVGEIPLNMEQSWTVATNALGNFLSRLDELTGVTDFISKSLQGWAQILDDAAQRDFDLLELQQRRLGILERVRTLTQEIENNQGPSFLADPARRELERLQADLATIEKQLKANNAEALKFQLPEAPAKSAGQSAGDSGSKPPRKPRRTKTDPNETSVKSLELEAATLGLTAEAAALYKLQLQGATQAQLDRAAAALESIEAEKAFAAAVEASEAAVKAENEAQQAFVASQRQYLEAVIASVDPTYELTQELQRLERLMAMFPAHAEIIQEAMLNVHEEMDNLGEGSGDASDKMSQFAIQAARNMQSAFADFLFDPFDRGLKGMLASFVSTLHRMVSELLSQQILKQFFTSMSGVGGGLGDVFKALSAGINHTGGMAGSGPRRQVSPLLFAGAPRYHGGGIVGLAPTEVPAILQRGEEVLPRTDPRHAANAGGQKMGLNVTLVDNRDSLGKYLSSSEGNQTLVAQIQRNASTIKRVLSI